MLKNEHVIGGVALVSIGYLLFFRKGDTGAGGGGGGGGVIEEVSETVIDELGGLGVTTPNYSVNIPGTKGDSIVFPDFPVSPGPEQSTDPVKPFDWPKIDVKEFVKNFDVLNELIGVRTEDLESAVNVTATVFTSKKGRAIIPALAAGNPISAILGGIRSFLPTAPGSPGETDTRSGTNIKRTSDPSRAARVAAFKKKYNVPSDYNYPVTHRVKA